MAQQRPQTGTSEARRALELSKESPSASQLGGLGSRRAPRRQHSKVPEGRIERRSRVAWPTKPDSGDLQPGSRSLFEGHNAADDSTAFDYYPNLARVRRYVRENLSHRLSLGDVAAVAGLERTYFSTYFRRHVGIRFSDWLCALRVAQAMKMLEERDDSMTFVAHRVGFGDRRTMQRAFKRWTGVTPYDFKKRAQPSALWKEVEIQLSRERRAPSAASSSLRRRR